MSDNLSLVYTFNQLNVRIIIENDTIWFVLKDVCDVLKHTNSRVVWNRLDDDEKGVSKVYTLRGMQNMQCVNESGLYNVIIRSNSEKAKPFRRWVTHDVLPSIRKKGYYSLLSDENLILAIKDRARKDLSFLTRIDKTSIKAEISRELKETRKIQSSELYLHKDEYTKHEYKNKLYEIWGDDYMGFHKEWEFYLN